MVQPRTISKSHARVGSITEKDKRKLCFIFSNTIQRRIVPSLQKVCIEGILSLHAHQVAAQLGITMLRLIPTQSTGVSAISHRLQAQLCKMYPIWKSQVVGVTWASDWLCARLPSNASLSGLPSRIGRKHLT